MGMLHAFHGDKGPPTRFRNRRHTMTPDDLKAWRKRLGLSQERAAQEIPVSLSQYGKMERGTRPIRPIVVRRTETIERERSRQERNDERDARDFRAAS